MATRNLLALGRRSRARSPLLLLPSRYASTAVAPAAAESAPPPSSPPAPGDAYDRLVETVKAKIKRLDNPDPRFLRYASRSRPSPTTPRSSPPRRPGSPPSPTASASPPSPRSPRAPPPSASGSTPGAGSRPKRPTAPPTSSST
uniref:Uncharacterized protein n=1 Tax=Ananas comosus var. bracteatus TaxID=296719 RepID=A0A6V7Q4T7_ANACO|nr:unnamed protein product [Ananas comosus var. bracteatus]